RSGVRHDDPPHQPRLVRAAAAGRHDEERHDRGVVRLPGGEPRREAAAQADAGAGGGTRHRAIGLSEPLSAPLREHVRRRPRDLVPAAVYLLVTLAWSWPLPLHLTNRFTHDPGDPLLITYLMWWNAQAVPLTRAWWNAPYYWPMHDALALTDHLAGLSPLTTPLQGLGASPLTAYNITLIASTWWCGLATHGLMRRLGGSRAAAYCAGLAFAFAPYRTSQLGHLQLYACWWVPLMLLALHASYEERRARWLVLLGAAWALQGLTNGYFLFFVPVLVGWWLLWHTRLRPGDGGDGPRAGLGAAGRVLLAMGTAAAALSPFLLKYRTFMTAQGLTRTVGEMTSYSARLGSFTSVTPILRFWHSPVSDSSEQYLFPGLTVLALTAAAAFFVTGAWRDRRYLFYMSAAIVMALFCAGPAPAIGSLSVLWHPYTWLTLLPGFNGLRVPSRFFMLAALCLAVAAGLSLDVLGRRAGRWRPLLVA